MTYTRFLRSCLITFVLFVLLDAFWHGGVMASFYNERLMLINPAVDAASAGLLPQILFINLINAVTVTYVVLHHRGEGSALGNAAFVGGLIGFTVIATVNFLNNAFIPGWDTTLMLVDTAWGAVIGIVGGLTVAVTGLEEHRGFWAKLWRRK